jgi:hypothetical protein
MADDEDVVVSSMDPAGGARVLMLAGDEHVPELIEQSQQL